MAGLDGLMPEEVHDLAMPLRGTLDLRASTVPPGRGYGQASGLPSTTRSTPEPTTDQPRATSHRLRRSHYLTVGSDGS
jgi:hypothetical protein